MTLYLGLSLKKGLKPAHSLSLLGRTLYQDWRSMPRPRIDSTPTLCLKHGIRFLDFKVMANMQFRLFSIVCPANKTDNAPYILSNLC